MKAQPPSHGRRMNRLTKLKADRAVLISALEELCKGADSLAALCEWTETMCTAYNRARQVLARVSKET